MIERDPRRTDDDLYVDERRDDADRDNPGAGTAGGAIGGAAAGAIAGTVIAGPIGTAVGAAVGAVGGAALGLMADATVEDGIPPDTQEPLPTDRPGVSAGAGMGAPIVGGAAGLGVSSLGLPNAANDLGDAEHERRGAEQGPFDNPASYDETAAEIARDRPILVGDDPGYEAARDETERSAEQR